MTETGPLPILGTTPSKSMTLSSGWNLVGYNSSTEQAVSDALTSIEGKYISVWAYMDGGWKVYDPENPHMKSEVKKILSITVKSFF